MEVCLTTQTETAMTYLEKLNAVLLSLEKHHSEGYHNLERITVYLEKDAPEIDFGEIRTLLDKLYRDGYVDVEKREIYAKNGIDVYYRINIDGRLFNEQGAYVVQQMAIVAQNKKVEVLEKRQKAYEYRMTCLTIVIALGTAVAALYYGIEVWKYFHPSHP